MSAGIPSRHPNQDRWDRERYKADDRTGSIDNQRKNLRATLAQIEHTDDPSARRTLEIKAEAYAAELDNSGHGRSRD